MCLVSVQLSCLGSLLSVNSFYLEYSWPVTKTGIISDGHLNKLKQT